LAEETVPWLMKPWAKNSIYVGIFF
jgi:hypothetical protein